jgi:hypothetical protein
MSGTAVLADVERLVWRLSGWQVDQRDVSRLLDVVEAYALGAPLPDRADIPEQPGPAAQEPQAPSEPSVEVSAPDVVPEPAAAPRRAYSVLCTVGRSRCVWSSNRGGPHP